MGRGHVEVVANADDGAVADWLAGWLSARFGATPDAVSVAVPGGATPFPILDLLLARDLPWPRLTIWPTDDRLVPEDHPASNTGRLRALFAASGARVMTLHETAVVPRFALVWLGMGADGHVASLFPSSDPRADDPRRVARLTPDPLPPEAPFDRITLTLPALLASDELVFVIRGADKRAVFDAARSGDSDLPVARLLAAAAQPVTCFAC